LLNKNIIIISICATLSFFFIILSFYPNYWLNFFGFLFIPPQVPGFSDFWVHIKFLECKELGLTLYENCPEVIFGSKYNTHPSLWIKIFEFLKLKNFFNLNFLVFFILMFYFSSLFYLSKFVLNFKDKVVFLLATFSTSNLLLVERLATDCVIFLLLFFLTTKIRFFIKYFLFFFAIMLKIYPVFALPIFCHNKKKFFIAIAICCFSLFFLWDDIVNINKNLVEFSRAYGYGSRSISKGIYLFLKHYNYLIIENYNILKNLIIFLFLSFFFLIFCSTFFKKKFKKLNEKDIFLKKKLELFLLGSSIFIFTFIFGSSADYRLIFLFFVLPYVLNFYRVKNKIVFLFCLFVSLNSLFFEKGYEYSLTYYVNVSFVYLCKLILFTYLSFTYGYVIKNYIFFKKNLLKNV